MALPNLCKSFVRWGVDCLTWDPWCRRSWSQEGEDIVLRRLFRGKNDGFYVDVGAHHPKRFSNTYLLYRQGWTGINIDPRPSSMRIFEKTRPRDINLEIGVATTAGTQKYYMFNDPALNGFNQHLSEMRAAESGEYHIIATADLPLRPLGEVFSEFLNGRHIDFLTVDVEGLDLDVLHSNNWTEFRPSFLLVEILGADIFGLQQTPTAKFLYECGYNPFIKLPNTVFFYDTSTKTLPVW